MLEELEKNSDLKNYHIFCYRGQKDKIEHGIGLILT